MIRGGKLIKLAREARGMTQEEVADAFGVHTRTIQRWEAFCTEPKFCEVTGVVGDICKMSLNEAEVLAVENH